MTVVSLDMAYCSFREVLAGLDTRLNTPPSIDSRHPDSGLAPIPIVHLRCRFGGTRAFFICPGPGDGADCGRRITKLHLSQRYFLCRHCNQLAYASQYEQPWKRALRRANKFKQRLGVGGGIAEPLPDKPKGMWTRTYGCLLDQILQAEMLANEAQANRIKRLLEQVEDDLE